MIKSKKVYPPLIRYCAKVIPLAFDESISYYECICNIANHINNEIIPKVNESNEIVNEVQNEFVELKEYVDDNMLTKDINDLTYYTLTSDLSTVALSGDYNDLSNKPVIPTVPTNVSSFNNDSGYITKNVDDLTYYTKTTDLSTVATTGDYDDLLDKPTIPDVSNLVSFTNYASNSNTGVIKANTNFNTQVSNTSGSLYGITNTYSQYESKDNNAFITKGTLENVITGKELNNITDSGTNYIKYSDGTLIQWGVIDKTNFVTTNDLYTTIQNLNIYRSNNPSFNFPIAFINTNYSISFEGYNGTSGCRLITTRLNAKTETGFSVQLIGLESFTSSETGYTNLINVSWIAVGKWK